MCCTQKIHPFFVEIFGEFHPSKGRRSVRPICDHRPRRIWEDDGNRRFKRFEKFQGSLGLASFKKKHTHTHTFDEHDEDDDYFLFDEQDYFYNNSTAKSTELDRLDIWKGQRKEMMEI